MAGKFKDWFEYVGDERDAVAKARSFTAKEVVDYVVGQARTAQGEVDRGMALLPELPSGIAQSVAGLVHVGPETRESVVHDICHQHNICIEYFALAARRARRCTKLVEMWRSRAFDDANIFGLLSAERSLIAEQKSVDGMLSALCKQARVLVGRKLRSTYRAQRESFAQLLDNYFARMTFLCDSAQCFINKSFSAATLTPAELTA